jgi:hypothetical protein
MKVAGKRFLVCVGTSHTGTAGTVALSQMAQDLGADGVMVTPVRAWRSKSRTALLALHNTTRARAKRQRCWRFAERTWPLRMSRMATIIPCTCVCARGLGCELRYAPQSKEPVNADDDLLEL